MAISEFIPIETKCRRECTNCVLLCYEIETTKVRLDFCCDVDDCKLMSVIAEFEGYFVLSKKKGKQM